MARAIADAAGATAVFDGGDDTSTGKSWEAFSLDSVTAAFDGLDRWGVAGNHDHGAFVHGYLVDHGWTMLDGEVVDGPGGSTLLGVDDPRSSGLGSWRDETGLSFAEVEHRLADAACAADERVTTLLVHDANLGREALDRGCVDLVLGGHLHVRSGPTAGRRGRTGEVGYTLHDRDHRRRGVRHRARQQAAPRRRRQPGDLPRRPPGRHPVGDAADRTASSRSVPTSRSCWPTPPPPRSRPDGHGLWRVVCQRARYGSSSGTRVEVPAGRPVMPLRAVEEGGASPHDPAQVGTPG